MGCKKAPSGCHMRQWGKEGKISIKHEFNLKIIKIIIFRFVVVVVAFIKKKV